MESTSVEGFEALRNYISSVELSEELQDRLITIWLSATRPDQETIALLYYKLFTAAPFIDKIKRKYDELAQQQSAPSSNKNRNGKSVTPPAESMASQHTLVLSRKIDDAVCRLQGPGPFPISFHVVQNQDHVDAVVSMYSTQFKQPDAAALRKNIVVLPRNRSTRTRRQVAGDYTWYIFSHQTQEVATAVTVNVINMQHSSGSFFASMPLFATATGYKKLGLARLLYAALKDFIASIGGELILVSADPLAVPFWTGLGLMKADRRSLSQIEFYLNETHKFHDSQLMIWRVPQSLKPTSPSGMSIATPNPNRNHFFNQTLRSHPNLLNRFRIENPTLSLPDAT